MRPRDLAQRGAIEHRRFRRCGARGRQPVVKTLREWTGLAVTGLVRMFAGLVARDQLDRAQRRLLRAQYGQRIQCERAPRRFRGEEKQLVDVLRRQCFQQRKDRAQRLADAGRRLCQQAAAGTRRLVHRLGQLALTVAKIGVRKFQHGQRRIARAAVRQFAIGPLQECLALRVEKLLQIVGRERLAKRGLFLLVDVEIHQRDVDRRQQARFAQQPAVDFRLCPVQRAVVVGQAREIAAMGLDFLEPVALRIVAVGAAVGAAANRQMFVETGQRNFGFVMFAAARDHDLVTDHALQRRRRRCETQIEIAALGGEFAQRAHGDGVIHAAPCHCTKHTLTGIACCAQNSSQRS
jgi:hypothetical protein